MFSSWRFRSSPECAFGLIALAAVAGCKNEPTDPRFEDPAILRPNGSKKLTVVFVDGVPVPAESANSPVGRPHPRPEAQPEMPGPAAQIGWQVPSSWKQVPPSSPVRTAEYSVPPSKPGTDAAEVGVFFLGPAVTSVDETLTRWASSFDEAAAKAAKRSQRKQGPFLAHLVEASGTYHASSMMTPENAGPSEHSGWMLIGAIVETPMGPYYFKLLGPEPTVSSARSEFLAMIDSVGRPPSVPAASGSAAPPSSK